MADKRFKIVDTQALPETDCPCGTAKRAFLDDPDQIASLHVLSVSESSRTHYHQKMTEIYYVLEGNGQVELDGLRFDVSRGTSIMIKPGCRHRAIGKLKILNIPIPAFDEHDEYFD
ncbi:MAG: mannose-6-phosphate isomerase-like protein (cupin superfamily) [Mariniblastus sp.]|jgi:mannose-6-phosphate isomerase-like protein (cupin superfamily)